MLLFRAILSFCSILAPDFSCAMSVKFVQCWRGIFSNRSKIKIVKKWCCLDDNALSYFPVQCCLEPLGFLSVQCCPKSITTTLNRFFMCNVVWRLLDNTAQSFYLWLCNVVQRVLGQHWTQFFPCNVVWSLLDNIVQGFYLYDVVPRVLRQHWTGFFLCNVVWSFLDNIARGFYLWIVVPWLKDNFYEENNLYNVALTMLGHTEYCLVNIVQIRLRQYCTRI